MSEQYSRRSPEQFNPLNGQEAIAGATGAIVGFVGGLTAFVVKHKYIYVPEDIPAEALAAGCGTVIGTYGGVLASSVSRYFSEGHFARARYEKTLGKN